MRQLKGSCLCNKVQFVVDDDFQYSGFCHCSECRKFSGSGNAAVGAVTESALTVTTGNDSIQQFQKNENTILHFCRHCGSSLYSLKIPRKMIHLRLGSLDDNPSIKPAYHVFVGSKADWEKIIDDLPQFEATPT